MGKRAAVAVAIGLAVLSIGVRPPAAQTRADTGCAPASTVTLDAQNQVTLCGVSAVENRLNALPLYVYKGIRYATAERWENPVPAKPTPHTKISAVAFGNRCPQSAVSSPRESEDCLFLNVYAPQDAVKDPARKLPVMVFIHGGAFVSGAGEDLDGARLAERGAVVVTLNYRLGALGFLVTEKPHRSGNYGFLDQQTALQWVHDHVAKFGGDANRITLFGESAGAMSVGLHTLTAPASVDLFAAAIMQSNPMGVIYMTPKVAQTNGRSFINALCSSHILKCRPYDLPASEIVYAQSHYLPIFAAESPRESTRSASVPDATPGYGSLPVAPPAAASIAPETAALLLAGAASDPLHIQSLPWAPHVDGTIIIGQPINGYAEKSTTPEGKSETFAMRRKPIAFGVNSDEGIIFAVMINDVLAAILKLPVDHVLTPQTYDLYLRSNFDRDKVLAVKDRYDPDSVTPMESFNPAFTTYGNVLTDYMFVCGNLAAANKLLSQQGTEKIYGYRFSQRPFFDIYALTNPSKPLDRTACAPKNGKVCHANELPYVFNMIDVVSALADKGGYKPETEDIRLADDMVAAWSAFAANPSMPGNSWIPYQGDGKVRQWSLPAHVGLVDLNRQAHCDDIWLKYWPYRQSSSR